MQILLVQEEIEQAIETFVRTQIAIAENQKVVIDLKAGRGDNGFTASLDIRPIAVAKHARPGIPSTTPARSTVARQITETQEDRAEDVGEVTENLADDAAVDRDCIPETSSECSGEDQAPEAAEAPASEAGEEKPAEPRKGSIFNFANKAGAA